MPGSTHQPGYCDGGFLRGPEKQSNLVEPRHERQAFVFLFVETLQLEHSGVA
jgi:hypothetical protein